MKLVIQTEVDDHIIDINQNSIPLHINILSLAKSKSPNV